MALCARQSSRLDADGLLGPLKSHTLCFLQPHILAALRGTCRALQHLVDSAASSDLHPTMAGLLPAEVQTLARTSLDMQMMLLQQASTLKQMHANPGGTPASIHAGPDEQVSSISWSPEWPEGKLAVVMSRLPGNYRLPGISEVLLFDPHTLQPTGFRSSAFASRGSFACIVWGPDFLALQPASVHALGYAQKVITVDLKDGHVHDHTYSCWRLNEAHHSSQDKDSICNLHTHRVLLVSSDPPCGSAAPHNNCIDVRQLPGMQLLACLKAPQLHRSMVADLPRLRTPVQLEVSWFAWSPKGDMVAVSWSSLRDPGPCWEQALTVFSADTWEVLMLFDAASNLVDLFNLEDVTPAGTEMRVPRYSWLNCTSLLACNAPEHVSAVIFLDGSCTLLESTSPDEHLQVMGQSPCGRFVHAVSGKEELHVAGIAGQIWDAKTQSVVFHYVRGDAFRDDFRVVWSPQPGLCLIEACNVIVSLDSVTKKKYPSSFGTQYCDLITGEPNAVHNLQHTFSPCGRLLISTWQIPMIEGVVFSSEPIDDDIEQDFMERHVRMPSVLWHTEVSPTFEMRPKQAVCTSRGSWVMSSMAWHPCPSACLYAIADSLGSVYLIDGKSHSRLHVWARIHRITGIPRGGLSCSPHALQFSRLGTMLFVQMSAEIRILRFA